MLSEIHRCHQPEASSPPHRESARRMGDGFRLVLGACWPTPVEIVGCGVLAQVRRAKGPPHG